VKLKLPVTTTGLSMTMILQCAIAGRSAERLQARFNVLKFHQYRQKRINTGLNSGAHRLRQTNPF
jgi:hypothetical protein